MSQKSDRKELRQPDEFQAKAGAAMTVLVANQRPILIALGAVAVAAVLFAGVSYFLGAREAKAGAALSLALELDQRPIAGEGAPQPGQETYASKDEREKAVLAALEKVRSDNPSTLAAQTAQAQVGFHKLKDGDAAAAQKALQDFLASSGKDHPLRAFAIESLGYAQEAEGKLDDAAQTFAKLGEAGAEERAKFQQARIALLEKKPDAKALLEAVAKDYPKDPVSMEANLRLELSALPPVTPGELAPKPEAAPEPLPAKPTAAKASGKSPAKPVKPAKAPSKPAAKQ